MCAWTSLISGAAVQGQEGEGDYLQRNARKGAFRRQRFAPAGCGLPGWGLLDGNPQMSNGLGRSAIEVWNSNKTEIRLVLTDLVMPDGMTGKELGERLLAENPQLNIVYMSGYSAEVIGKDFPLQEGINFLTKPFPASKLAQTIRRNLHGKE